MNGSSNLEAVSLRDLTVVYRDVMALEQVTVDVASGAVTGIIGPNGAGKTTLLKTVAGLHPTAGGTIRIFGGPVGASRERFAYVPQREAVDWQFPVRVIDVVRMGRFARTRVGRLRREDREIASAALNDVGMADLSSRQIGELSGGQQQRVFIARALAQQADLLILDEPFAGIDAASQESIYQLLHRLKGLGKTVLLSTHDLTTARYHCDDAIFLNRRLIAAGPVEETFSLETLEQTYGGRLLHLHGDHGVLVR
ncbi:MAG TPA: metal ABC transporter ATP-binding protein [Thermomicrobiaceae bacterium]|nr:metal ABC transporter ATP-binding protein [Thermomicrobiaceae bacterium]